MSLAAVPHPAAGAWPAVGRRHDIAAALLCMAVLVLGVMMGAVHQVALFNNGETDFYAAYGPEAENIRAGRPYTYRHQPPGYALLIAGVGFLTDDLFTAGKLVSSAGAALFGGVTYSLLRTLFDPRIALLATSLSLLAVLGYSFLAATDMIGAALVLLPIAMLVRRAPSRSRCFVIGLLSGVALLVRYNLLFVGVGSGVVLLVLNPYREALRRRLLKVMILFGGVAVVTVPWFITNGRTHGEPFLNTSHLQIAYDLYLRRGETNAEARLDEAEIRDLRAGARSFASLSDVVGHDPARFVRTVVKNVLYEHPSRLLERALKLPASLFVGAGLVLLLRDLTRRRVAFLAMCVLGYALLGLARFTERYYLFLYPLLFAAVAYFIVRADAVTPAIRLRGPGSLRGSTLPVSWLLAVVLVAAQAAHAYRDVKGVLSEEPRYVLEIAAFLRQRSTEDDRIITRKPHLAYLAGLEAVRPPSGGLLFDEGADLQLRFPATAHDFLSRARELGARYIAYSDQDARQWRELQLLGDPSLLGPGVQVVYRHVETGTIIYEIDDVAH